MPKPFDIKPHREFMDMLCKAAGLETHRVREISCSVGVNECVTFSVQLVGESNTLRTVLGEKAHMCATSAAGDPEPTRGIPAHEFGLDEKAS